MLPRPGWLLRPLRPSRGLGRPACDWGDRDDGGALTVTVESATDVVGCPMCGVLAHAHGRVDVHLVDARDGAVPTGGAGQSARPGRPSGALAGVN